MSKYMLNIKYPYKLGFDLSNVPDETKLQYIEFIQSKKHKKKRINKKWLKRYGYKQVVSSVKGWNLKSNCKYDTFEFI